MASLRVYTDGGARGNPGPAAIGALVLDSSNQVVLELSQVIGSTTNNIAEYQALITTLEQLQELGLSPSHIQCFSDSQLMVKQVLGEYKVKTPHLLPLKDRIVELLSLLTHSWQITHIKREQNSRADALVNQALNAQQ